MSTTGQDVPLSAAVLDARAGETDFDRLNKPRPIEEPLDLVLHRPLGYALTQVLRHIPLVTPNMVSVAAIVVAGLAGWALYQSTLPMAVAATLLLTLRSVLDSVDGQLARATGRVSELGRIIDGFCDNLSFFAVYLAICLSLAFRNDCSVPLVILLGLATGFWQSCHCGMPDYTRLLLLDLGYGENRLAREAPEVVGRQLAEASARRAPWLERMLLRMHFNYVRQQRLILRESEALRLRHEQVMALRPELRVPFALLVRAAYAPMFRRWAMLAPNSYQIGMIAAAFLPHLVDIVWIETLGTGLFLVYVWLLNIPFVMFLGMQSRIDRGLRAELERMAAA